MIKGQIYFFIMDALMDSYGYKGSFISSSFEHQHVNSFRYQQKVPF